MVFRKKTMRAFEMFNRNRYRSLNDSYDGELPKDLPKIDEFANMDEFISSDSSDAIELQMSDVATNEV